MESPLYQGTDSPELSLPELKLIETLLWDGQAYTRLPLHAARMARSAATLGWPFDKAVFDKALGQPPGAPARTRITADRHGQISTTYAPLPPAPAAWRATLATARLTSSDPWLRLKTTRRALYDQTRATLPPGIDEAIFLNERGEVCEGTITNIFFDRGHGLRTPPLTCGLLPGVLRESLNCPEEILPVADLPRTRLWLGNSLRGLIPATFAG